MIIDLVWKMVHAVLSPLVDALPTGTLDPSTSGLGDVVSGIAKANSVIPIAGPMMVALGILSAVVAFVLFRIAVMIWQQVPFT